MSEDDVRWAEQLLARTRAVAQPRGEDAARNLASIEERLGISLPASSTATPGVEAPGAAGIASREVAPPSALLEQRRAPGAAPSAARAGLTLAVKAGLVLSFGLMTGVVGNLIGRAETQANRDHAALDALTGAASRGLPAEPVRSEETATSSARLPAAQPSELGASVVPATEATRPTEAARARAIDGEQAPVSDRRQRASAASSSRTVAPRAVPQPAPKADVFDLSEALELLRRAEAAVRRSDGLEARIWLTDLDRRAPRNVLVEERLVTSTLADCLLGDVEAARATLRELEASNSESIYRARLEGSCVAELMPKR